MQATLDQELRLKTKGTPTQWHRQSATERIPAEYPGQAEECYDSSLQRQNHDYVSTSTKPLT
jgi:hypothetical protein